MNIRYLLLVFTLMVVEANADSSTRALRDIHLNL
jgi:hypothetical protein